MNKVDGLDGLKLWRCDDCNYIEVRRAASHLQNFLFALSLIAAMMIYSLAVHYIAGGW